MLLKPTLTIMLLASLIAATMLTLLPWQELLSEPTPLKLALVSVISVFMPFPIALDVMFAAQLRQQGVASWYVMLFAMTLRTYSVIPASTCGGTCRSGWRSCYSCSSWRWAGSPA